MTRTQMEFIKILAEVFEKDSSEKNFNDMFLTAKIYFREEEDLYKKNNHPDLILHKTLHKEFERVLFYFYQSFFKEKSYTEVSEFCRYVRDWAGLHYECYDKPMLPYINISQFVEEIAKCKKTRS